tara:strand:+ start:259 stop:369 length:111 start_codon:yes stop_codon:yes gene_type:complete
MKKYNIKINKVEFIIDDPKPKDKKNNNNNNDGILFF